MPRKKIVVMSLALALLAALAVFSQRPRRDLQREEVTLFPEFDKASVLKINIAAGGDRVLLHRDGEGWLVGEEGFPADGGQVEGVLDDLAGLKRRAVAARKTGGDDAYGLDAGQGRQVTLSRGEGSDEVVFTVGRGGPDGFSSYLSLAGEDEVLLVSVNLDALFARPLDGWRDRAIVKAEAGAVREVAIAGNGEVFTLEKGDGDVWVGDGAPVDPDAVTAYVERLVNLRAAAFAPAGEEERSGFDEPEAEVTYTTEAGTARIIIGALDEERRQRYVKEGEGSVVYLVSQFVAGELVKSKGDFLPPADAGDVQEEE